MELIERYYNSQDWITLVIASCFLILTIAKWVHKNSFNELLSAAVSDRYIKVSQNENKHPFLRLSTITVYFIGLALWILKLINLSTGDDYQVNDYLLIFTGITVFVLVKRYLSMAIASLMQFENILETIEYHRNTYRAVLGTFLLVLNLFIYYVIPEYDMIIWSLSIVSVLLFLSYNFILLFTYYKSLVGKYFYFMLYLCTLEIAPYLLLYKYFMLWRAY